MDYLVIARKYRPQSFAEVVGQEAVARTLTNAIRLHRVHHAYLFTGPRGVGKTSMARIFAKALCCVSGPTTEPCGVCEHCRRIADSAHPDVVELDAARYTGVDHVRELSEAMVLSPVIARAKVYILDEVHMFSASAWNALLKVLEEPPAHVHFVFATTAVERVPETIISRCQRFDFRNLEPRQMIARLAEIAQREGVQASEAVLTRIARAAGGGMRDAQTLLDQAIAISDGAISEADLDLLLGAARGEDLREILRAASAGASAEALLRLDACCQAGVSPATLLAQLIEHTRGVLLLHACGPEAPPLRALALPGEVLRPLAEAMTPEKALRIVQVLLNAEQQLRHGVEPRLALELALVRIARLGEVIDLERLLQRIERLERGDGASPR
ncbi:MAG: DNA polymerase III subunit gamma/tau [Planctomycetota bacterium]|nr:DNA polymerase III subunit gamma/tau [Planctomycetota bacterium]MCX8040428.1 DNA polymerase III subunit gamma/tau [Planctomycetota bacterium]MDW8373176.1 DNA polymerase III subunit gamma/tau [Planctomycetota bacterium]